MQEEKSLAEHLESDSTTQRQLSAQGSDLPKLSLKPQMRSPGGRRQRQRLEGNERSSAIARGLFRIDQSPRVELRARSPPAAEFLKASSALAIYLSPDDSGQTATPGFHSSVLASFSKGTKAQGRALTCGVTTTMWLFLTSIQSFCSNVSGSEAIMMMFSLFGSEGEAHFESAFLLLLVASRAARISDAHRLSALTIR